MKMFSSALAVVVLSQSALAQTIWNDGGGDQTWSTSANWSAGVPTSVSNVQIGTQPTGDLIGIDTGATTVSSFTFNNSLTAGTGITAFGVDTLQVNGAISNNSTFLATFLLPVNAGASATWTGGTGGLALSTFVNIGTNQITLVNTINFGTVLNFDLTNTTTFGRFLGLGTGNFTGTTINIGGSYTGILGNTFDLTTGNFSGATLSSLPPLTGGLSWNSSNFLTSGILTVIPEPTSMALTALGLVGLAFSARKRRTSAIL